MNVQEQIKNAIDASVEALNNVKPNWLDFMPLNVKCIDVMNADKCILHYAFGDFWKGWGAMRNNGYEPARLAFSSLAVWERMEDDELFYARSELRLAWRDRVTELRG